MSSFLSQKPVIYRVITTSWQFIDFTLRISLPPTCATRVTVRLRFVFPGFNVFSAFTFSLDCVAYSNRHFSVFFCVSSFVRYLFLSLSLSLPLSLSLSLSLSFPSFYDQPTIFRFVSDSPICLPNLAFGPDLITLVLRLVVSRLCPTFVFLLSCV